MFCKLGAEVAITGRNVENLSKTADECEKSNGKKVINKGQKKYEHMWIFMSKNSEIVYHFISMLVANKQRADMTLEF